MYGHSFFGLWLAVKGSRDVTSVKANRNKGAFEYVGCACYDLNGFSLAYIDLTYG